MCGNVGSAIRSRALCRYNIWYILYRNGNLDSFSVTRQHKKHTGWSLTVILEICSNQLNQYDLNPSTLVLFIHICQWHPYIRRHMLHANKSIWQIRLVVIWPVCKGLWPHVNSLRSHQQYALASHKQLGVTRQHRRLLSIMS